MQEAREKKAVPQLAVEFSSDARNYASLDLAARFIYNEIVSTEHSREEGKHGPS